MKAISPNGWRVQLSPEDGRAEIRSLLADPRVKVVQFFEPVPDKLLDRLNEEFFSQRPEVELRVYGYYQHECNLEFCSRMSNVERFRADCLLKAVGVENVTKMPRLTLLGIAIESLESFAFLQHVSPDITSLWLGGTHSKKPNLAMLSRFKKLKVLSLASQQKSIEAICGLQDLETIHFWGLSLESVDFLKTLPSLKSLDFSLGGTRNLAGLAELKELRSLELCWVRGLVDVSAVGDMTGLEDLALDRLAQVEVLPKFSKLTKLRKLRINSLKKLANVSELVNAPALENLIVTGTKTEPEDYLPVLRKGQLKQAGVWFTSKAKDKRFEKYCLDAGILKGSIGFLSHPS